MSSFFTLPSSVKKRKRQNAAPSGASRAGKSRLPSDRSAEKSRKRAKTDDESISSGDSELDVLEAGSKDGLDTSGSDSELEGGTDQGRRIKLAERYLENTRREVDAAGFDAADIDRDLIAERLKEDVAEEKGKLYRRIGSDLAFDRAAHTSFRTDAKAITGVAACDPYLYIVTKDIRLQKWELANSFIARSQPEDRGTNGRPTTSPYERRKPKRIRMTHGSQRQAQNPSYQHHTASILCVAASADGKFVATGGADRRLIIWDATNLNPLRVFTQHRDAVTALSFRRGTNQLYSASKDRTIKTWSLDTLAYVETLFGHQDEVVDVAALAQEQCISVGARDRTARLWKVVEESQLVFRGGGGMGSTRSRSKDWKPGRETGLVPTRGHAEGSIDRVAMIDEETFVTGSDNGSLCLWNIHKKKPVFTYALAHGLEPPLEPEQASAETNPDPKVVGEPTPRWITALTTVPYSDLILSGSWDGHVRAWRIGDDKRRIEALGPVGKAKHDLAVQVNGEAEETERIDGGAVGQDAGISGEEKLAKGVVNDLAVFERGERGKESVIVVAALGNEHRMGRWIRVPGKNTTVVFEISKKDLGEGQPWTNSDEAVNGGAGHDSGFEGFGDA
ncbi:pre-rRNA processing protein [Elasticomyces elasticus]|nr:pre-rRNA processing protein [Elasticomyces elasticus]